MKSGYFIKYSSRNREESEISLSLVKSLVELHNREITLISKPNKGSRFIIRFATEPLTDPNAPVDDYKLDENKVEMIRMEFSDIYIINFNEYYKRKSYEICKST